MPNIAITSYCNLHCPYCFAQQMFKDNDIKNISIEQFDKILKWIEPYAIDTHCRIGIIGGEPTLHPNFETIMEHISFFCEKYNCPSILFTNGIEFNTTLIKMIPDKMRILINYNSPIIYSKTQQDKLNYNLELLNNLGLLNSNKITIGNTLCEQINNYDYLKNIIIKYNLSHIRLAVDRSAGKWDNKEYYLKMKNKFLDFIDFAIDSNTPLRTIGMDCRIPINYFTKEEQEKIFTIIPEKNYTQICCPEYEIFSDFKMSSCFTHYKEINCQDYNSFKEFKEILIEGKQT